MCSPLPLRLWCMAAMAPALTTEAATRARDTLTPPSQPSNGDGPVVNNGRVFSNSVLVDASCVLQPKSTVVSSTVLTGKSRIVTLPKEFILDPRQAHRPVVSRSLVVSGRNVINLGTISDLSKIYQSQRTAISVSATVNNVPQGMTMTHTSTMATNTSTAAGGKLLSLNITAAGLCGTGEGHSAQSTTKLSTQPVAGSHNSTLELSNGINVLSHSRVSTPASVTHCSVNKQTETVFDTSRRQRDLELRVDRMLHRLRRLQSRQSVSHTKQQLSGFIVNQQKNLDAVTKLSRSASSSNIDLKAELLQSKDVKNLSTAALVNLVHKLQSSQPLTLRQHLAGATSSAEVAVIEPSMKLDGDLCAQLEQTAGQLKTNLRHLESSWDSDATESSSGGESCDEMDYGYTWDEKLPKPGLHRRAEWRWNRDRSAVASRWTWLQAQVSDLEYRIRQQNDIYRQIRMNKGAVTLGDPPVIQDLTARTRQHRPGLKKCLPAEEKVIGLATKSETSPCNISTLLCNIDKQTTHLTQQLGNVFSPQNSPAVTATCQQVAASRLKLQSQNGFVEHGLNNCTSAHPVTDVPGSVNNKKTPQQTTDSNVSLVTFDPPSPANDVTCQSVRCRPVQSYRKRKLLRTAGLHLVCRKAARLSAVRCHCYPPVVPCAICGGRYNNTQTTEPEVMTLAERVALLDASYHAILSFPEEIPLSLHFESLLRTGDWQAKTQQHKSPQKPTRLLNVNRKRQKLVKEHIRKYNRRLPKSTSAIVLSSAKIRSKYEQKQLVRGHSSLPSTPTSSSPAKKRLCRTDIKLKKHALRKRGRFGLSCSRLLHASLSSHLGGGGDASSPLGFHTKAELREAQRRRRGESAFDINNIVIPYSIAAATRVEKLQYKEIITPKWREIITYEPLEKADELPLDETANSAVSVDVKEVKMPSDVTETPSDVTETPSDVTETPSDVTETSSDVTETPSDVTETPSDVTNTAVDISKNLGDVTKPPDETSKTLDDVSTTPIDITKTPGDTPVKSSAAVTSHDTRLTTSSTQATDVDAVTTPIDTPTDVTAVGKTLPVKPSVTMATVQNDVTMQPPGVASAAPKQEHEDVKPASVMSQLDVTSVVTKRVGSSDDIAPAATGKSDGTVELGHFEPITTVKVTDGTEGNTSEDELANVEDLSDEVFAARHLRCEIREKKYFVSFLKSQRSRRSCRTESSSTVASDPASPSDSTHFESLSSPGLLVPPATPTLPSDDTEEGRQRSGSTSSLKHDDFVVKRSASVSKGLSGLVHGGRGRSASIHADMHMVFEEERYIAPWPVRNFPLDDSEFELLSHERPPTPDVLDAPGPSFVTTQINYDNPVPPDGSTPTSPLGSSSNSSLADDDPNDPEWTCSTQQKSVPKLSLVLKLTKR